MTAPRWEPNPDTPPSIPTERLCGDHHDVNVTVLPDGSSVVSLSLHVPAGVDPKAVGERLFAAHDLPAALASPEGLTVDALSIALQRAGVLSKSHMTYHDIARCVLAALGDGRDDLGAPDEHERHKVASPVRPEGCGECMGWPGHHPDCSKYGIPRTEAGARLLVTLENLIYRGGTIGDVARADIVAIEDEAEHRAANRAALASPVRPEGLDAPMCMSCGATESYRCSECGSDDPTGYFLARLSDTTEDPT